VIDGHFREKWTYVALGANFFINLKGRKEKGKEKEKIEL
jgi:hypothetical protein